MLEETVFKKVVKLLNKSNISYMLTGGLAVTVWGRVRSTLQQLIVTWLGIINMKKGGSNF